MGNSLEVSNSTSWHLERAVVGSVFPVHGFHWNSLWFCLFNQGPGHALWCRPWPWPRRSSKQMTRISYRVRKPCFGHIAQEASSGLRMDHTGGNCANCATRNYFPIDGRRRTREFEQRRFGTWWGVSCKTRRREHRWLCGLGCMPWLPTTSRGCQSTRGN